MMRVVVEDGPVHSCQSTAVYQLQYCRPQIAAATMAIIGRIDRV